MVATSFTLSGVDPAVGAAWQERFVSRLRTERLKVTTAQDVQQLLGLERQRALLADEFADCASPDSYIGLGGAAPPFPDAVCNLSDAGVAAGNRACLGPLRANGMSAAPRNTPAWGQLWVR